MSENRVIGHGSKIPWHLPEDFKWFKKVTTGQVVIMGRKTYDSIGKPLPNRTTIVLSRSSIQIPGIQVFSELGQIDPGSDPREFFICGGAQIYAQALPLCSDLYLTKVKRQVEGDILFPPFEKEFYLHAELHDGPDFRILHYRNRTLVPE